MYKLLILVLFVILRISSNAQDICSGKKVLVTTDGVCPSDRMELVFEDHFDGNSLDKSKWKFVQPWANHSSKGFIHSLEYQTDGLNYVWDNGVLKLEVRKEKYYAKAIQYWDSTELLADGLPNLRWWDYTAGMIYSQESFGFGKYEIRCKIPKGKGFWSVFWLFGAQNDEIDVFEFWNEENVFGKYDPDKSSSDCHMTVHANDKMCMDHHRGVDFSKDFHTFSVVWSNNKMEWYVDDVLRRTIYKFYTLQGQPIDCHNIREDNLYILNRTYPMNNLNIGVSLGIQAGKNAPDENTVFPAYIEVDYVKYWRFL